MVPKRPRAGGRHREGGAGRGWRAQARRAARIPGGPDRDTRGASWSPTRRRAGLLPAALRVRATSHLHVTQSR